MAELNPLQDTHPSRESLSRAVSQALRHVWDRSAAAGIVSQPLAGGRLPLRRWLPQGAHSLLDIAAGVAVALAGQLSGDRTAQRVSRLLGLKLVGTTLLTDSQVTLSRLVPIELHELVDYGWGLATLAAPFVGGYARRAPGATAVHVLAGTAVIVGSLVTDYRCRSGMHLGHERITDPGPLSA
ncbi:hypothetical protein [Hyalangium minutum]|uniref:Uncharacterized protein n=1 Tax=Hyalangium minutum TaxID=394096 RepID=A0A085WTQ8_9BACT|nr:hypothetical protein [Hyalangium minutum]KFE71071.1 hypothetical protein DB31_3201 [Hyalangium minutum]